MEVAAIVAVPRVSIMLLPVMIDVPLMVPLLITEELIVLVVSVCCPMSVIMTPDVGNVAVEFTPVPPRDVDSVPATAAACERLTAPNDGVPPAAGTTKLWYGAPAAVDNKLLDPLPTMTPLLVKLAAPVPPLATGKIPEVIAEVGSPGMSETLRLVPQTARPLLSTLSLV